MELTQRLEFTQELYSDNCEKPCPEQIGFLGICGTKYPLKKGPNKIGRDPQTCNIVLNLNSISRQHAVINILNTHDFMLMDLDSANKTKLADKILEPYIPHPLKNGDMVQFGEVFGVFRLLEEENDLPMTQAMDIPDTPVHHRHISKVNIHATTVPESPEVSDKEDSFIGVSQHKPKNVFKSPNNNFLKSNSKTAIKTVGTKKQDNVYWNSSKKTDSFSSLSNISHNLDETPLLPRRSDTKSIHEMDTQIQNEDITKQIHELDTQIQDENLTKDIHELDTQIPKENITKDIHEVDTQIPNKTATKDIHELDTQIPNENLTKNIHDLDTQVQNRLPDDSLDSIYNAATQIVEHSPDIYELETQVPTTEKLPEVYKIENQENLQINSNTDNKENDIYNAKSQVPFNDKLILQKENIFNTATQVKDVVKNISPNSNENVIKPKSTSSSNISDDIILFEEIESEPIDDNFESQQLLSPKLNVKDQVDEEDKNITDSQVINFFPQKRANRIESDSSTDCEDINIVATQIIPQINQKNEDLKDESNNILKTKKNLRKSPNIDEDVTDCEDFDENDVIKPNTVIEKDSFEDLLTQVLDDTNSQNKNTLSKNDSIEDLPTQIIIEENKIDENIQKTDISEFPTQVLDPKPQKETCFEEALTQKLYSEELVQFKVPLQSPVKKKKKTDSNVSKISEPIVNKSSNVIEILDDDDEKYYAATQELFDDLCSQKPLSPNVRVESDLSKPLRSSSTESSDIEEKVSDYVSNLTCSQIQDVVGVQKEVTVLKKVPSDGSDVAVTPKKIDSFAILETDLPNTQEIKTGISLIPNSDTESLPDLIESEIDSLSEKSTPIKVKKHKAKMTQKIRINLSDKFDPETIPVRSSSRVRKPTTKIQNCDETFKDMAEKILKPVSIKEECFKQSSKHENTMKKNSSTKDNTTTNNSEKVNNIKINNLKKLDSETYVDNKSKRGSTAKKKSNKNDQKQKPKANEVVTDNFNEEVCSNSTERKTRSKQKEEAKRKIKSKLTSKTTTPDKSKSDDTSKSIRKPSREITKSPEMIRKSKERSKSPKIIKKSRSNRERSKSPEIVKKSKPIKERSTSPEIIKKTKPTIERSKSPEIKHVNTRKHAEETSSELEFSRKPKERPKSSEKIVTRKTNKDIEKSVVPMEAEVRRSTRNRKKKTEEPINNSKAKSPIREMSAVYSTINISPDTSSESPSRKRVAPSETEKPTAKKPKSILRATPARKCKTQYVLFTAFACEEVKDKLEKLGAVVVSDVLACTVVLTLQIKRTFKLLCAVGLGKPIVGPNWVQACADTNMIVDPWLYLLQDETTEKRFKFNLQRTLAGKREFLKGYNVSSTPNVMPNQAEMKLIVECSGGQWREGGPRWVCVSTPADRALWPALRQRGAVVVSTEFILGGVLTQNIDIDKNLL